MAALALEGFEQMARCERTFAYLLAWLQLYTRNFARKWNAHSQPCPTILLLGAMIVLVRCGLLTC